MRRNTPLFVLVTSGFIALAGLLLWLDQACFVFGSVVACSRPYGDLGTALAAIGGIFALAGMVLEAFAGSRQRPPDSLPVPPECVACGAELLFYHDYGLWYCPNCKQYSAPRIAAPRK